MKWLIELWHRVRVWPKVYPTSECKRKPIGWENAQIWTKRGP